MAGKGGPARHMLSLDQDWLFGGKLSAAALEPGLDDTAFSRITLPHCVAPLSWQKWDPAVWEDVWLYRRHFAISSELNGLRLFLHVDRIMAGTKPVLNGQTLPEHLGGFLPFEYEITSLVREKGNVLSIAVDSRWQNVPPAGSPKGPRSIDYLLPGGICGSVSLRALPHVFISDVFAKPVRVLDSNRRLEINCSMMPA
jgi:beta-galactosidase